ncbi:MAG: LuxR C-terminal-related transcriptional regulator [Dehalococcoidia bacterium]
MPLEDLAVLLERARDAFARRDWVAARDRFRTAREQGPLSADDTYALGDSVWWLGSFREAQARYEEAYRLYLNEERPRDAAMTALGIGGHCFMRGDEVIGSGWMHRALRLLQDEPEGAEHGYLLIGGLESALGACDLDAAIETARRMQEMGQRFADPNLHALGQMGEGKALIKQGRIGEGIALLDEAMLTAVSDELAPAWAGNIYCQMMRVCHELFDLRRAGEWTRATARWCESLPAAGPFMGVCRVHRAQVLQVHGAWEQAEREAMRVCEQLADFDLGTVSEGYYQMGEVRRQRGDLAGAEEAYRLAHQFGRQPQPGLALLRLAQGRTEAASASIRSALATETLDRLARARLCAAQVEIALAAGDHMAARLASDELEETARIYQSSGLLAAAEQARSMVLLADGEVAAALQTARAAGLLWQQLNAPYESARVRLLLAQAHQAMGGDDAATLELDAAEAVFVRLGAALDANRIAAMRRRDPLPGGLSEREAEVLRLVASGCTNREIGAVLVISEKTVARHLSNIFAKLDLTSRTAAAAYAFEHGLAIRGRG